MFLATMLGEAAVWRPDKPTPTGDQVLADPRYALYLAGWPRQADYGLVAEQDGPVGAAWCRTFTAARHGYGFVAEDVLELSIAVIASRRHEGIGRRLLIDLIAASEVQGYAALSLNVNYGNPAWPIRVGGLPSCREGSRVVLDNDPTRCPIKLTHYRSLGGRSRSGTLRDRQQITQVANTGEEGVAKCPPNEAQPNAR